MRMRFPIAGAAALACSAWMWGCAAGPDGAAGTEGQYEENAVVHTATPEDTERLRASEPIAADTARLYVNGLGCPLCASNVDQQLSRQKTIRSFNVDLSTGIVSVAFAPGRHPSPRDLVNIVEDAGFTLVKIETP